VPLNRYSISIASAQPCRCSNGEARQRRPSVQTERATVEAVERRQGAAA